MICFVCAPNFWFNNSQIRPLSHVISYIYLSQVPINNMSINILSNKLNVYSIVVSTNTDQNKIIKNYIYIINLHFVFENKN